MKKLTLFATLFALLLGACTPNELDNIAPEEDNAITLPDLTAGFADDDVTKTYVEESKYLRWHEADLITAFYGNTLNRQYKFNGKTGDNSGTFSLIPSGELGTGNELGAIYAIYPYDAGAIITDKGEISLTLPATQLYAENSFGKDANTMIAVTESVEDTFLGFKNACGYLQLKLYNESGARLKSVEVKGNNGEKIAGSATVTIEFGGVPTVVMGNDATTTVTLDCGEDGIALGTTAETATELWVVLPEVAFEGGITITATDTEGGTFEKSTTNPVAITRNDIQPMAVLPTDFMSKPANNEIWYTATAQVTPDAINVFGATYLPEQSTYDSETQEGILVFGGDVTTIGRAAFNRCTSLTSVTLPDSVTSIGEAAFYACSGLQSVTIPSGITSIGVSAFTSCDNLVAFYGELSSSDNRCLIIDGVLKCFAPSGVLNYDIPEGVKSIGSTAFSFVISLTSVTLPNSITSIEEEAFYASSIETITIPNSVTSIGNSAFSSCSSLISVNIPNSVTSIGESVFDYCSSLTSITIPDGVISIGNSAFAYCSRLFSVTIPDSVTSIGESAFSRSGLNSVSIGSGVKEIGKYAFACGGLETVVCKPINPPTGGNYMFSHSDIAYVPADCTIYVLTDSESAYKEAQYWSNFASHIEGTLSFDWVVW